MPSETPRRSGRVALAGRPNAGKSSLLNALVGEPLALVSVKAQATRHPVVGLRTDRRAQYVFHDLPGLLDPAYLLQNRLRAMALAGIEAADVILQLHPAPDGPAPTLQDQASLLAPPKQPVITVYTKVDLLTGAARGRLPPDAVPVSARSGEGLDLLLQRVADVLPRAEFAFPDDDLGTQPMRFFVTEYIREAAFTLLEDELPYALAAEVEEFREDRDPVYIRATLYVERESQKRIVVGSGGRTIKAIGQHARERTERLLGRRVYLETWIKVLPGWRRSDALLTRLGFPEVSPGEDR